MTEQDIALLLLEVARLERENELLHRTIAIQKRQLQHGGMKEEVRRLRAKIAEWEGSSQRFGRGFHHGDRFILAFEDREQE